MADIRTFEAHDKLTIAAADLVTKAAVGAVRDRGRFVWGLSGGTTPAMLYRLLAEEQYASRFPWEQTYVFWSDERWIEPTDSLSNQRMVRETLLDRVPIPQDHVRAILTAGVTPIQSAEIADRHVRELFDGRTIRPDLILLGMGEDGHTASLFPGTSALLENEALFVPNFSVPDDMERITATLPLINAARQVILIVTGAIKAEAVRHALFPRPNST
ncbi:MAG: 6-phosphogluconolactonase, partial [Chloroflexi bacterium]|nr:6-phosphogluconolactonase [Chloroflexota bacterium]